MVNFNQLGSTSEHCYSLDCAPIDIPLGFGGYRSGKIYEIRALESRGKSTLGLEFVFAFGRYWLKKGKEFRIKWIETESAFDITRTIWMEPEIGPCIEVDEAETVETAHRIAKDFLNECMAEKKQGIIVWDTLAAAATDAQKEKNDQYGGGQMEAARYLRYMFRDLTSLLGQTGASLILPNQTYMGKPLKNPMAKIPKHSYGGGAIKYHTSVRIDIQDHVRPMTEMAENGSENDVGIITQNDFIKNKITGVKLPFQLYINNENGLDKIATTLAFLQEKKICRLEGSWKKMESWEGKDLTWQSQKQIQDKILHVDPTIKEWMDYKIYEWYAKSSPLVKLRTIEKVWEYEKKFFDKKVTELTEKEAYVGKKLEEHLVKEQEREDKKETETKKKTTTKKKAKKGEVAFV